jgi:hypothetical protein
MATIKTSELTGKALDYAVALCEGLSIGAALVSLTYQGESMGGPFSPSTDWAQGGPIVEREGLFVQAPIVRRLGKEKHAFPLEHWRAMWCKDENELAIHGAGQTPLIAAMRCFVASKMGDSVEIPDELLKA